MMRFALGILLILAIGNPVCCCAFPVPAVKDVALEDLDSLPPCCRARALAADPSRTPDHDGDREETCPCPKKSGFVLAEKATAPIPMPQIFPLALPSRGSILRITPGTDRAFRSDFLWGLSRGDAPPLYLRHRALLI